MKCTYSVSPNLVEEVSRVAQVMGYDVAPSFNQVKRCKKKVERISAFEFCHLLGDLKNQSGDPDIGLKIGQQFQASGFNILGHLVMASQNIGEALPMVQRFQQLVIDCADSDFRIEEDQLVFCWTPYFGASVVDRVLVDLVLSAMRNFAVWATGVTDGFEAVYFQYDKPQSTEVCEEIFGHPGHYGCHYNGFSIPKSWCKLPIRAGSDNLKPIIYEHAELLLDNMVKHEGYIGRVTEALIHLLPQGQSNIEAVASVMNMSSRTLQRHLNEQGSSFGQVLQSLRFQMSNYFLLHTQLPIHDIAMRVGYKVQSSFSDAYKGWSGMTPVDARAQLCRDKKLVEAVPH